MKKFLYSLLVVVLICSAFLISCAGNEIKFPSGIDTVQSFGDGSFQICRGTTDGLFFIPTGSCLMKNVDEIFENGNKVYILGHQTDRIDKTCQIKLYAVISVESNSIQICAVSDTANSSQYFLNSKTKESDAVTLLNAFSDFSEEDQNIFGRIEESAPEK